MKPRQFLKDSGCVIPGKETKLANLLELYIQALIIYDLKKTLAKKIIKIEKDFAYLENV